MYKNNLVSLIKHNKFEPFNNIYNEINFTNKNNNNNNTDTNNIDINSKFSNN